MPFSLTLNGWLGLAVGTLRTRLDGVDFVTQGIPLPEGDIRSTKGYFVATNTFSVVLGTRKREDGEGMESFLEVTDRTPPPGNNVKISIEHYVDGKKKVWKRHMVHPDGNVENKETDQLAVSVQWIEELASVLAP